jgi:hypothetical protein
MLISWSVFPCPWRAVPGSESVSGLALPVSRVLPFAIPEVVMTTTVSGEKQATNITVRYHSEINMTNSRPSWLMYGSGCRRSCACGRDASVGASSARARSATVNRVISVSSLPAARRAVNRGGPVQQHRGRQWPFRRVVAAVAVRSPVAGCPDRGAVPRRRRACHRPAGWSGRDPRRTPLTQ